MATAHVYGNALLNLAKKKADLSADALKVMLLTSAYTPAQATHQFQSDLTGEVVGTGYTAGGQALTSVTLTQAGNVVTLDAADSVWNGSTITARYAVVVDTTPGSAATNPLICYVDFTTDFVSTNAPFTIQWNASGIVTQTAN
jgi:hypothetical protein